MIATSPLRPPTAFQVAFDFLGAKLRGRRSRLFEGDRLRELAGQGSLRDLAWRLYPREEPGGIAALERRMLADCVAELASLARYLDGAYRAFYVALLGRYPVENLKVALRLWGRGEGGGDPRDYLVDLPPALRLRVDDLLGAADIEAFVEAIPLPAVRECAQGALPLYGEDGRKAYLEMAFDKGYWQGVWATMPRGMHGFAAPVRAEFDAMRLLGTLRAARRYGMPWEQWRMLLPAGPGQIGDSLLRGLHADPRAEFAARSLRWLESSVQELAAQEEGGAFGHLEELLWRRAVRLADRQYYAHMTGPGVLISYFYLKRNERRELFGIAQMLRYGRSAPEIIEQIGL
ncbi:MAG: hypothetical protein AMK73_08215 [Planctomycetes bacterium SM23_32]|nr:MAG: hypothetical protein AMK73_08215 [Planctomycetes bacterium SM23_32]